MNNALITLFLKDTHFYGIYWQLTLTAVSEGDHAGLKATTCH